MADLLNYSIIKPKQIVIATESHKDRATKNT